MTTTPADTGLSAEQGSARGAAGGQMGLSGSKRDLQRDPRDPDHSKTGIFVYHSCWKCKDGELPCAKGHTLNCDYPHARND